MSLIYPNARKRAWTGALDLEGGVIKAALVRPTTSCGADVDAKFLADFANLDESTVGGYARELLTGVQVDDPGTGPVTMLADDLDFGVLDGNVADPIGGILLFEDNGGPSSDVPIAFLDSVRAASISFPYQPTSKQFLVEWFGGVVLNL